MMGEEIDLSVVIPVYRSAGGLPELVCRLVSVLDDIAGDYEIIFVDDGSSDDSWQILQDLRQQHPQRIVAIQLMRNFGQHNALMCGLRNARGRYVVTMDDDLQNPPEELPKLIGAIKESGADLVYGNYEQKKHVAWRNFGSFIIQRFYRYVFKTAVPISAFRIMKRELVEAILPYSLNFTFIDGLLAWNTLRIGQVAVTHQPRTDGRSGYSLSKLVFHAANIFTNFSLLPLQVATAVGLLAAICGFGTGVYYAVQALLSNIAVPGYASIIVAVLVLGGLQLLALGIIGEYIGRVHLNINKKPQYTVRQVLGAQNLAAGESEAETSEQSKLNCENADAENGTQPRTNTALEQKL